MKKFLLLMLALLLLAMLPACEKDDTDKENDGQETVDPDSGEMLLPSLDEPITLPEDIFE